MRFSERCLVGVEWCIVRRGESQVWRFAGFGFRARKGKEEGLVLAHSLCVGKVFSFLRNMEGCFVGGRVHVGRGRWAGRAW